MIITELVDDNTRERRYSDKQVKLLQVETGNLYDDAVDVIPCKYTYKESKEPIDPIEPIEQIIQNKELETSINPKG